jgi:hypothetical protein
MRVAASSAPKNIVASLFSWIFWVGIYDVIILDPVPGIHPDAGRPHFRDSGPRERTAEVREPDPPWRWSIQPSFCEFATVYPLCPLELFVCWL